MPQTRAIKQALEQAGLAEVGVVRIKVQAAIVGREGDDPAVAQNIDHPKIDQDLIVIEFATGGGADIAGIRARMCGDFLLLINQG